MAEYKRVDINRGGGRRLIGVITESKPIKRSGNVWRQGFKSQALAVHPHQAKRFTEAAHEAGITGVHYDAKTGDMRADSRQARVAEYARRGYHDQDAGYGETKYLGVTGQ